MLKRTQPRGQNLGRGVTILKRHLEASDAMHEEVDAFHAPSECHADVSRGSQKDFRLVRRRIKGATGLSFRAFMREVERRTSGRWSYFNLGPV